MRKTHSYIQKHLRDFAAAVALTLSVLLLVSCGDTGNQPTPSKARLRLLHLAYDAPNIDMRIAGGLVSSSIQALSAASYQTVDIGSQRIAITSAGTATEILSSTSTLQESRDYTVFTFPPAAAMTAVIREDQRVVPVGKCNLRFVNATTDGGQLELRISSSGSAIAGPIGQASVSDQKQVDAGTFSFGIYKSGVLVSDYDPVPIAERSSFTIVVHGTVSTSDAVPLGVRVFTDNGSGDASIDLVATSFDARLTAVNAIIGAANLSVAVGGTTLSTLTYGQHMPYASVVPGSKNVEFAISGTQVTSPTVDFASRKSYSVFATGSTVPPDVAPLVLVDVTTGNAAQALVRFINLSPDIGKVDVLTPLGTDDYAIQYLQGIDYRVVSRSATSGLDFLLFPPSAEGTPYRFKFRKSGSTTIAFEVEGVAFQAGKIYTMWIGGRSSNNTLEAYLIRHN